jgi:hypothetical protein
MWHMPSKSIEFLQQSQCYYKPGLWSFTSNEHGTDAEYLLWRGVGRNIAKPDTGEARTCEVKSCNVRLWMCYIVYRNVKPLCQCMDPTCKTKTCMRFPKFSLLLLLLLQYFRMWGRVVWHVGDQVSRRTCNFHLQSRRYFHKNTVTHLHNIQEQHILTKTLKH